MNSDTCSSPPPAFRTLSPKCALGALPTWWSLVNPSLDHASTGGPVGGAVGPVGGAVSSGLDSSATAPPCAPRRRQRADKQEAATFCAVRKRRVTRLQRKADDKERHCTQLWAAPRGRHRWARVRARATAAHCQERSLEIPRRAGWGGSTQLGREGSLQCADAAPARPPHLPVQPRRRRLTPHARCTPGHALPSPHGIALCRRRAVVARPAAAALSRRRLRASQIAQVTCSEDGAGTPRAQRTRT